MTLRTLKKLIFTTLSSQKTWRYIPVEWVCLLGLAT